MQKGELQVTDEPAKLEALASWGGLIAKRVE